MISIISGTIAFVDDCGTLLKCSWLSIHMCKRADFLGTLFIESHYTEWAHEEGARGKTQISNDNVHITRVISLIGEEYWLYYCTSDSSSLWYPSAAPSNGPTSHFISKIIITDSAYQDGLDPKHGRQSVGTFYSGFWLFFGFIFFSPQRCRCWGGTSWSVQ